MSVDSSSLNRYTPDEIMTIAAARLIWPGCVCFVGIGVPSTAANLARLIHAPDMVLIYESGAIGTRPRVLPSEWPRWMPPSRRASSRALPVRLLPAHQ